MDKDYDFSIIIPWVSDHGHRQRIFDWVRERWVSEFSNKRVELLYGDSGGDRFSRAASRNMLADRATSDILVFADADIIPMYHSIDAAVNTVKNDRSWTIAYAEKAYYNLNEETTEKILNLPPNTKIIEPVEGEYDFKLMSWAGMFSIRKDHFKQVLYDERFINWGHEDVAFVAKATAYLGKPVRVNGFLSHLYHDRIGLEFGSEQELENRKLFEEYKRKYHWKDPRV